MGDRRTARRVPPATRPAGSRIRSRRSHLRLAEVTDRRACFLYPRLPRGRAGFGLLRACTDPSGRVLVRATDGSSSLPCGQEPPSMVRGCATGPSATGVGSGANQAAGRESSLQPRMEPAQESAHGLAPINYRLDSCSANRCLIHQRAQSLVRRTSTFSVVQAAAHRTQVEREPRQKPCGSCSLSRLRSHLPRRRIRGAGRDRCDSRARRMRAGLRADEVEGRTLHVRLLGPANVGDGVLVLVGVYR